LVYVGLYELTHRMEIVLLVAVVWPRIGIVLPEDKEPKEENAK